MKKSNRLFKIICFICLILFTFSLVACGTDTLQGNEAKPLSVTTNVRIESGTLRWNAVEQSIGYTVEVKSGAEITDDLPGEETMVSTNEHSLLSLPDGDYNVRVKARGDSVVYSNSDWSDWVKYTRDSDTGAQYGDQVTGAFGSFDEINTRESYLGYGIDIINATGVTSKNIKTTYPIFSKNAILNETLLKSNEHYSNLETIEAATIEEFKEKLSRSTSISSGAGVSASGNIYGVDVSGGVSFSSGFKSTFEQTSTETHSQYFLEIIAENQNYWLMLQTSEARYKELLSEEFKKDLYDTNISPATLFDKYGTHLLTSVAMGGNISMFYTLYSTQEGVTTDQYYEVSTSLKANADAAYGGYSGGVSGDHSETNALAYQTIANKYGIRVEKKIVVSGGSGSFGIINESSLLNNYAGWQASLDAYPVVVGIKDSNSLYPIWQLIDTSVPGGAERYQELYNYFAKYGTDSYNSLCKTYGITAPVAPTDITSINVKTYTNYMPGEIVQIKAGDTFQITFDVLPDNANKYKKTFRSDSEYVTVDESGNVTVSADIPNQLPVTITITAGPVEKTINMTVISTCNVIFNTVVPDLTVPSIIGINSASTIQEPTIIREGYILDGWYRDATYQSKFNFESDLVITNLILYAKWTPIKPIITFDSNGGSTVSSQTIGYKAQAQKPADPTLDGYLFDGWYTDRELTCAFDFSTLITGDTTLYAKWSIITYTVKFETNGGLPIADKFTNVDRGYKITEVIPEKNDHTFIGWYLEPDFFTEFTFDDRIVGNTTLYAKWEAIRPVVTFNSNGGSEVTSQTIAYGGTAEMPQNPTKGGYTFGGWYRDAELTEAFDFSTPLTRGITLYAKWNLITYTISFDVGEEGATPIPDKFTNVERGYKISEVTPEKNNHIFCGWYYDTDCFTEFSYDDMITSNITLYAKWEAVKPVITFDSNGGSEVASQTVEYKNAAIEPDKPTKEGYKFVGWYADRELAVKYDFATLLLTHKTVYAKWEKVTYTVTFDSNGGSPVSEKLTDVDKNFLIGKPDSIRSGYELLGWYTDAECETEFSFTSKVTKDMTLYAGWRAVDITVTFEDSDNSVLVTRDGEEITTKTTNIEVGYKLSGVPTPYKEGYVFLGWKMGGEKIDVEAYEFNNTKANYKLTAIWIDERYANPVTIKVNYVFEDGSTAYEQYVNSTDYYFEDTYSITSPIIDGYAASELTLLGTVPETELVLEVVYKPAPYKVIITYVMADGSEAPEREAIPVMFGEAYSITIDDIPAGYTPDVPVVSGTMGSEDKNVTVTFTPINYTLTIRYRMSDGTNAPDTDTYTVAYNSGYNIVIEELRGYTADKSTVSGVMSNNDTEVIVTYEPKEYTVTVNYVVSDGSVELTSTVKTYKHNSDYSIPVEPLLGFTPDKSVVSGTIDAQNVTETVTYKPNTYSVKYEANGATGTTETTNYVYNVPGNIAVSTFSRPGYVFIGWNTQNNGLGEWYENNQLVNNLTAEPNGTVTLYAQWISISLEENPGIEVNVRTDIDFPDCTNTGTLGAAFALPAPTAKYYTFLGWYTKDGAQLTDGNGNSVASWSTTEDITLYAHWKQDYEGYTYIKTEEEFINIKNDLSGDYLLIADIDLNKLGTYTPIGTYTWLHYDNETLHDSGITDPFRGTFNGGGNTITFEVAIDNFSISNAYDYALGLFGTANGATFADIKLNAHVLTKNTFWSAIQTRECSMGGLVGQANNCSFTNITLTQGSKIYNYETDSTHAYNGYLWLSGYTYAGGIVGNAWDCRFYKCYNEGEVTAVGWSAYAGGIAGNAYQCTNVNESCKNSSEDDSKCGTVIADVGFYTVIAEHVRGDIFGKTTHPLYRNDGKRLGVQNY